MTGFGGALAVVRLQMGHAETVAGLPQPTAAAVAQVDDVIARLRYVGGGTSFVQFDRGDGLPCLVRARDVMVIDVTSTEDPGT